MTFMRKIMNALKMDNWQNKEEENPLEEFLQNHDTNSNEIEEKAEIPKPKKVKKKSMTAYDIERYAVECNAYVIKEERKDKNKS